MEPMEELELAAQLLDQDPGSLAASSLSSTLPETLAHINGEFTDAAAGWGIDRAYAESWLREAQDLSRESPNLDAKQAADLAVRLTALTYVVRVDARDLEVDPHDLLPAARPS